MYPETIYYEPAIVNYELGRQLKKKYAHVTWEPILNHNNIEELRTKSNQEFPQLKRLLIIGVGSH